MSHKPDQRKSCRCCKHPQTQSRTNKLLAKVKLYAPAVAALPSATYWIVRLHNEYGDLITTLT